MASLTPRAARVRRLWVQHTCQAITEQLRPERVANLDDRAVQYCTCGDRFVPPNPCGTCTPPLPGFRIPDTGHLLAVLS